MKSYLLLSFLFAALVLGGFMVGPLSVRVYFSMLFCVVLFITKLNTQPQEIRNFTNIYNAFIIVTAITLLLNGEFVTSNFIKKFLAYYFPALLTVYGVSSYINSFSDTRRILLLLGGIGVLTSVVTCLQYFGISAGTDIGMKFVNVGQAQNVIYENGLCIYQCLFHQFCRSYSILIPRATSLLWFNLSDICFCPFDDSSMFHDPRAIIFLFSYCHRSVSNRRTVPCCGKQEESFNIDIACDCSDILLRVFIRF